MYSIYVLNIIFSNNRLEARSGSRKKSELMKSRFISKKETTRCVDDELHFLRSAHDFDTDEYNGFQFE